VTFDQAALDQAKKHDSTMIMLAEQEAAFRRLSAAAERSIMLQKECLGMNERAVALPVSQVEVLSAITSAAQDASIDGPKLRQLLEMAERLMRFEAEREFNNSMRACQEEMAPIARNAQNTHTGTPYAKLESIDREIRPVYVAHGFAMTFGSGAARAEHSVRVTCDVRHSAGHTVQYELEGALDTAGAKGTANKTAIAGLGSTVTILRRYLTLMIWNITLVDPPRLVTGEQAKTIWDAIDAAGISGERRRQFLKYAGAESVETIGLQRFSDVMTALKREQVRKTKEAAK